MFSEETKRALLEEASFHHRRHCRRGQGSRLSRHLPKQRVGVPGRRRLGGGGADVEEESKDGSKVATTAQTPVYFANAWYWRQICVASKVRVLNLATLLPAASMFPLLAFVHHLLPI